MKLLINDSKNEAVRHVVDAPEYMPEYDIGSQVTAKLKDKDEEIEITGTIVCISIMAMLMEDGTVEHQICYSLEEEETKSMVDVTEDDIITYYPETNSFCSEYYEDEEAS